MGAASLAVGEASEKFFGFKNPRPKPQRETRVLRHRPRQVVRPCPPPPRRPCADHTTAVSMFLSCTATAPTMRRPQRHRHNSDTTDHTTAPRRHRLQHPTPKLFGVMGKRPPARTPSQTLSLPGYIDISYCSAPAPSIYAPTSTDPANTSTTAVSLSPTRRHRHHSGDPVRAADTTDTAPTTPRAP